MIDVTPLAKLGTAFTNAAASLDAFTNAYAPPRGRDDIEVLSRAAWPDIRQRFERLAASRNRPDEEPT